MQEQLFDLNILNPAWLSRRSYLLMLQVERHILPTPKITHYIIQDTINLQSVDVLPWTQS